MVSGGNPCHPQLFLKRSFLSRLKSLTLQTNPPGILLSSNAPDPPRRTQPGCSPSVPHQGRKDRGASRDVAGNQALADSEGLADEGQEAAQGGRPGGGGGGRRQGRDQEQASRLIRLLEAARRAFRSLPGQRLSPRGFQAAEILAGEGAAQGAVVRGRGSRSPGSRTGAGRPDPQPAAARLTAP